MDLLATGNTVKPGLPARTGDTASDSENTNESATFEVFLGLALTVPSPDAMIAAGPEGKPAPEGAVDGLLEITGNPAIPATTSGNMLPVGLPVGPDAITGAGVAQGDGDDAPAVPARRPTSTTLPSSAPPTEPDVAIKVIAVTSTGPAITVEPVANEPAIAKAPEILPRAQAVSKDAQGASQPAPAPLSANPQETPPQAVTAQAISIAHKAAPVARVLAGRQRQAAEPLRLTPAPEAPAVLTPAPAEPLAAVQPVLPAPAVRPDTAKLPSTLSAEAPESSEAADAANTATSRTRPEPAATQTVLISAGVAEPIAAVSDARASSPTQPASAASAPAAPQQGAAHQFGDLVDRLVRAREAETTDFVRSTLATRDFGTVSMQLRSVEGRLHVAMAAADPGFAPAVQAASALAGTGQQALSDSSSQSQPQQQQGQSAQQSSQGQSAPDSQARRQQWERAMQDQQPQGPATASGDDTAKQAASPHGAASSTIYA